jgi:integrase/recombinase XerD
VLDQIFERPDIRSRLRTGAVASLLDEYATRLHASGHTRRSIRQCIWAVEHFGSWLQTRDLSIPAVNKDLVCSFLYKHLPRCRCPSPAPTNLRNVRSALHHLLRLLRSRGQLDKKPDAISAVVEPFRLHLRQVRGLAETTCVARAGFAREFLERKYGRGALRWEALQPSDVTSFVAEYGKRCQPSYTQNVASALRTFLRYLQLQGWCGPAIVAAVPRVAQWRLSQVPRTMTDEQLSTFLATFDQSTAKGQRDYAMALCLADLGMRVSEVAGLCLHDLDWRSATLRIAPRKTGRSRELPLAARPGQAIAAYLRHGRLATPCRHVFVRHSTLRGKPVTVALIQNVMRRAYDKVPGCEHWTGTHVLRHTAATRMHRRGATLKEVADVLGHRSLDTTTIYAKVDLPSLAAVALPWPEAQL